MNVSVIVPCFNQGNFLFEALSSVKNQTYINWECIIVNDGSYDDTENIATKFCSNDSRFRYFKIKNGGLANARNFGIEQSNGIYILPLDADDKIAETYIEKAVDVLKNDNIKVVYCEAEFFGAKSGKWHLIDYSIETLAHDNPIFCSAFFRKQDFNLVGGYNVNMKYGYEDWDFWISLLRNGGKVVRIPEVSFYYRIKEQSMSTDLDQRKRQMMYMQLYLNHPDFFDQYYDMPVEVIPAYSTLNKYCKEVQKDNLFLKGLIKLKPASYYYLFKKIFEK